MDEQAQQRWTELQFFYILLDVLTLHNDMVNVMDYIEFMTIFGQYKVDRIQTAANEVLNSLRVRPTRQEFVTLAYQFKTSTATLKKRTGVHNRLLYAMLEENKEEPMVYYARTPLHYQEDMQQFIKAITKSREVGIP